MDSQLSDAAVEHEQRYQQFAVPVSPLHNDIILDGLNLPSLQSSVWSYSPPLSYQQVAQSRSAWPPAENSCPVISRDCFNQAGSHHRLINEASQHRDTRGWYRWHQPDTSAAFTGEPTAAPSFRTGINSDAACDTIQSNNMSVKLNSSPTRHTWCRPSPKAVINANPDDFVAFSDAELLLKSDNAEYCTYSCQGVKTVPACHHASGCSCRTLDSGSVDEQSSALKSEFPSAGCMTSCRHSEAMYPVTCKLHSLHCPSPYLTEESTKKRCDMPDAAAAGLHRQLHAPQQQLTKSRKTEFTSSVISSQQGESPMCGRQSAAMNELDDIDLPPHSASAVNPVPTEPAVHTIYADTTSPHDVGCDASRKPDSALRTRERGDVIVDDSERRCQASAKVKEKRSKLDVQNGIGGDASIPSSSHCPKQSSLSRKSKRKVQRATDEKLPPGIMKESVCDNNVAAFDGATDNNLYARVSDHTHGTNHTSVVSDGGGAKSKNGKKIPHKENKKSESLGVSCTAAEQTEASPAESVETEKFSRASAAPLRADAHLKPEMPSSLRHHRRSAHKPSRAAAKQKSMKHGAHEQDWTPTGFQLKRFLESIDWQRQHQNIGLFLTVFIAIYLLLVLCCLLVCI